MRRWTLRSRAERGGVILSGAWTTSTCYKPREIERTPQCQDGRSDRHARRRGTMPGLAMRTPHHGRQDLPRLAYRLERGIEPVAETEEGVHGHGWSPCLLHDHDQFREPHLLGIAGSHDPSPLSLGILAASPHPH